MESLATRFVSCYNRTDAVLREIARLGPNSGFSDAVRAASRVNAVVRRYAEDLTAFARLRNAIVHSSTGDRLIAEPHADVVEAFEAILARITDPPRVLSVLGTRPVVCAEQSARARRAVELVARHNYGNIPVTDDGRIVGLLTAKDVMRALGQGLARGESADAWLDGHTVGEIPRTAVYRTAGTDLGAQEAIDALSVPKMRAILLTDGGNARGKVRAIVTAGDIVALNRALVTGERIG